MDAHSPGPPEFQPDNRRVIRRLGLLIAAFCLLGVSTVRPHAVRAAVDELESMMGRKSEAMPAVPAKVSRRAQGPLDAMTPQAQAELLLDESIHNEEGALEDLYGRAGGWREYVQMTPKLSQELEAALNANDLQVRAAALDIYLAVYDVEKQSGSVSTLDQRISAEPEARPWALFSLGALGNRGIEPIGALRKLTEYTHDPNVETRAWTMESLAILGTNEAIDPLLDALRNDPSPVVRERAACGLAQSGMFTREQRRSAVPRLLDIAEDPELDAASRGFVFHALQDITGANAGSDAKAWRRWWQQHGS
jgi:HEAT repeat protein